ncbi:MAG: DUF1080 domain-containing protein [Pirellulaceae bacterium]|nr:DUF1080 domain-containing protein [Pirellulaceae bacterium]
MNNSLRSILAGTSLAAFLLFSFPGCESSRKSDEATTSVETGQPQQQAAAPVEEPPIAEPAEFEVDAKGLLAATLDETALKDGWISLFDGQSLFGWSIVGKANWRVEDGIIKVDRGEKSFLCTNLKLADCELSVDFKADAKTNSGVFLRTQPSPEDVTVDCIELNIAPPDNPFPTGSLVKRQKLEPADLEKQLGKFDPTQWHTFRIRMAGDKIAIALDGKKILEYVDDSRLRHGHISLQHNEGHVEFKNVRLRPLDDATALKLDKSWESDWDKSTKEGAELGVEVTDAGLKLTGGLGQLQSKSDWGDFILQATYQLAKPEVNSGIFFRCVRDSMLDGYECQLNHAIANDDPLQPADGGAGGIFRRAPARIVIGDGSKPTYVTLIAHGPHLMTWVNGIQVVDFVDTRPADDNPRKGLRTAAGPISLQGHDPTTEAIFQSIRISSIK